MSVKFMLLDGLCYVDQMKEIWRNVERSGVKNELGVAELFSRFRKNDKLYPVIPNYSINLFNPQNIDDYSIFKTDLQIIFGMLQYKEDKNALRRYMMNNEEYFSSMSYEAATATGTLLKNRTWFDRAISKFNDKGKEVCDMCKAIDDMISDGRA